MTADSGETWCAWRRTSTPSTPGILMSVTITSKSALSILRRAASPPVTVSTLWPSRRSAISSSSQMERSSSQTRMLPTIRTSRARHRDPGGFRRRGLDGARVLLRAFALLHAPQAQHKTRPLADLRPSPHLALMRLHDLINDRQAETGTAFKIRLERLEYLFRMLRLNAWTGIGEIHLPVG